MFSVNIQKKQMMRKAEKIETLGKWKAKRVKKQKSIFLAMFLYVFIFVILYLTGCERDFSAMVEVALTVKSSTVTTDGEVIITNNENQTIYVPFIHYPSCSFFIYELEHDLGNGQFDSLWYHSYTIGDSTTRQWLNEPSPVSVICLQDMSPIQLEPSQSFTQEISGLESGIYRMTVYYSYSEGAQFNSYLWSDHFAYPFEWFKLTKKFTLK